MIYFIEASPKVVKVGFTAQPNRRLRQLQTAHPKRLKLLRLIAGDRKLEAVIHNKLKHKKFHIGGEWFALDADQVTWLVDELSMDGMVSW